jgi:hypothetical protein
MSAQPSRTWQVGQKVICVDGAFSSDELNVCDAVPISGVPYTIREIRHTADDVAFLFEEITNPPIVFGREPGFWQSRFDSCEPSRVNAI